MEKKETRMKSYKFRVYPQTSKVEKSIQKQFKMHAMLYNEAKEQIDNRYLEYKKILKENVLILLDSEDDFNKRKFLNDYIDFTIIESTMKEKYDEIKSTWKREDIYVQNCCNKLDNTKYKSI